MLLIDPYTYQHLSMKSIRIVNSVLDALMNDRDDVEPAILIPVILEQYKEGMQPSALMIHVKRAMNYI
jgi:hypothetical protein